VLERPPRSWDEFAQDVLAVAHEIAGRHGRAAFVVRVVYDPSLTDHRAEMGWDGVLRLGRDTQPAVQAVIDARAEGRPLTFSERRDAYATYRAATHEALHAAAPIQRREYHGELRALEEALTEELSSVESARVLRRQGLEDVLSVAHQHPSDAKVEGSYSHYRKALGLILARGGVVPETAEDVLRSLKFDAAAAERPEWLAGLLVRHAGMGERDARGFVRRELTAADRATQEERLSDVLFAPIVRPDLSDLPEAPALRVWDGGHVFEGQDVLVRVDGREQPGFVERVKPRWSTLDVRLADGLRRNVPDHAVVEAGPLPEGLVGVGEPAKVAHDIVSPGDVVSYLSDRPEGRSFARVERVVRPFNYDLRRPAEGWQLEARALDESLSPGRPVILTGERVKGLRVEREVRGMQSPGGSNRGIKKRLVDHIRAKADDPETLRADRWAWTNMANELAARRGGQLPFHYRELARSWGLMQHPSLAKYGPVPVEPPKFKLVGPGVYESPDGRLTMYRIEGLRPPAWNVERHTDYLNDLVDADPENRTTDKYSGVLVDGAASKKDAEGLLRDAWPFVRRELIDSEVVRRGQ
jgi:hypothetical protein